MVYLKENSKIKDKFVKNILNQEIRKTFFASKWEGGGRLIQGIDLYTGKYGIIV